MGYFWVLSQTHLFLQIFPMTHLWECEGETWEAMVVYLFLHRLINNIQDQSLKSWENQKYPQERDIQGSQLNGFLDRSLVGEIWVHMSKVFLIFRQRVVQG
jgi:hypothetical protein